MCFSEFVRDDVSLFVGAEFIECACRCHVAYADLSAIDVKNGGVQTQRPLRDRACRVGDSSRGKHDDRDDLVSSIGIGRLILGECFFVRDSNHDASALDRGAVHVKQGAGDRTVGVRDSLCWSGDLPT